MTKKEMKIVLDYVLKNAEKDNPKSLIKSIDRYVEETGSFLMNVGPEKGKILVDCINQNKGKHFLELGAFIGYSAILIGMTIGNDAKLLSIDSDEDAIEISQSMINFAGLQNKIDLINMSAESAIPRLNKPFDFIFIDHAKKKYYTDLILLENNNLIKKDTLVFADNVGIFKNDMNEYFNHVRDSGLYSSKNIESCLEYRDNIFDAVEVSIFN